MMTISKLISYCEANGMLARGQRVLCAVSGGSDSVAMLCMLLRAAPERDLCIQAAHYNHRLRGAEADRDEAFVRNLCREFDVPFHSEHGDVALRARELGKGIEETARLMRYDFLERTADLIGADAVATAHTADDNAETVLMNLARGSGARGLAGIPPKRGRIIRPLLCYTRQELRAFLDEIGTGYVDDSTNDDPSYTRNRIRLELVPVFRAMNPAFARDVLSASELLRADDAFLDGLAAEFLSKQPEGRIDARALRALTPPVAARVIRQAVPEDAALSRERLESVLHLAARGRSGSAVQLPGGFEARLDQGRLSFGPAKAAEEIEEMPLTEGRTAIPGTRWGVTCAFEDCVADERCTEYHFVVRGDAEDLNIRARAEKDALFLPFRGGTKTLKKLFIDAKIPVLRRGLVPVLASGSRAIAVPGFGVDEDFRAAAGERAYIINFAEE